MGIQVVNIGRTRRMVGSAARISQSASRAAARLMSSCVDARCCKAPLSGSIQFGLRANKHTIDQPLAAGPLEACIEPRRSVDGIQRSQPDFKAGPVMMLHDAPSPS